MKLFSRFLICIFLSALVTKSTAQTHKLKFNLVSGTDGITLGKVNSITRDMHGIMWFTDQTNRCIVRYDGTHMIKYQYDPKNPNSLGGTYPECIVADSSGMIWIGFYGGTGLDKFDPVKGNFTHYRHHENDAGSLASDIVAALLVDHLGNLWVGTNGGLDLFDQTSGKFKHYSNKIYDSASLSYNIVRVIYEDHEGNIWVGTGFPFDLTNNYGGLNRFDRKNGTFTRYLNDPKNDHSLINNKVRAIFEDSKGIFWVGTQGDGLHTMDKKTGLFERHTYNPNKPDQLSRPPDKGGYDHITFITEDAEEQIWIGTLLNGINRYDPVTKKITHFGADGDKTSGFKDIGPWLANTSNDGMLWICTQQDNLYKVDLFSNFFPFYTISKTSLNAFYEETPTIFWFATDSGLVRKDLTNGTTHIFNNEPNNLNSLVDNSVVKILKDEKGNFWIGTNGGLNRFNPKTGNFIRYQHNPNNNSSLISDHIQSLFEDKESNLWIGTWDNGIDKMNTLSGTFVHYQHSSSDTNSISNNLVTSIFEDETNDIWTGTWGYGGINRLNIKTGKFKHYLSGSNIVNICKDSDGIIWVVEENGLFRYNKKSDDFSNITEGLGFNINDTKSAILDDQDNLWIGAYSGIYMINKNRDRVIFYGKENGILSQTLNYGTVYKKHDGELFFGGYLGYFSFYPDKIKINSGVPKIEFSNFWINGQLIQASNSSALKEPLNNTKEIHLKYNQNIFSLSFNIIDYGEQDAKRTYYKLDNYDKEWRKPSSENSAYYFNLPVGKYIFRVKAVNSANGIWQEKDIAIIISPPWWNTWWAYIIYALLFIALAYSVHRFQKDRLVKAERERTRARELAQAKEIEKAYHELKTTQQQLIQSEKMASLGELTAGIAHEIQNPLNFVNNFSEVNSELIGEMNQEIEKGNFGDVKSIAKNIEENEQKIIFHGKRADAIVKGMLQHSRSSSGQKEPTDINALCDEYLRLSYHGLRAKDKSFNAKFETSFDDSIGKINIISQDIGRVILNLINNAFYVVNEKAKQNTPGYEPTVTVSTKKINGKVEINVKDNGNGIPDSIKEKIFQPFYTTKPTGSGTGLGLSLSYDIVKAHSGEIKVETKEGIGSEFIILLS